MNNDELDRRIAECVVVVDNLVQDLKLDPPNVEHAIALGALLGSLAILKLLVYEDVPSAQLSLLIVDVDQEGN